MWPFEKKLKDQDAVEKYRDWLKKWLFSTNKYRCAVGALAIVLVLCAIMISQTLRQNTEPAFKTNSSEMITLNEPAGFTFNNVQNGLKYPQPFSEDEKQSINGEQKDKINYHKVKDIEKGEPLSGQLPPNLVSPVTGSLIADYGLKYSQAYGDYRFNDGLDFLAGEQDKIVAPAGGRVLDIKDIGGDKILTIDHGNGWLIRCRGKFNPAVKREQQVSQGDLIGKCYGHAPVHMVLLQGEHAVDPLPYITLK